MSPKSASPKDITGALVKLKKGVPKGEDFENRTSQGAKASSLERAVAFDPLTFSMWCAVGLLISAQLVMMLAISIL